jgi:hypothetical protein
MLSRVLDEREGGAATHEQEKKRKSRELDLPVEPLVYLCPVCRQVVEHDDVEPSKSIEQTQD